jgi:hypothetical protein
LVLLGLEPDKSLHFIIVFNLDSCNPFALPLHDVFNLLAFDVNDRHFDVLIELLESELDLRFDEDHLEALYIGQLLVKQQVLEEFLFSRGRQFAGERVIIV